MIDRTTDQEYNNISERLCALYTGDIPNLETHLRVADDRAYNHARQLVGTINIIDIVANFHRSIYAREDGGRESDWDLHDLVDAVYLTCAIMRWLDDIYGRYDDPQFSEFTWNEEQFESFVKYNQERSDLPIVCGFDDDDLNFCAVPILTRYIHLQGVAWCAYDRGLEIQRYRDWLESPA